MLDRLRAYQGADQADLFGPALEPNYVQRAFAALRKWFWV